jgi:hypothetical protein
MKKFGYSMSYFLFNSVWLKVEISLTIYDIVTKWSLPRKLISSIYDMILSKRRNKNQLQIVMCDSQRVNLICVMSFLNISILIDENKKKNAKRSMYKEQNQKIVFDFIEIFFLYDCVILILC